MIPLYAEELNNLLVYQNLLQDELIHHLQLAINNEETIPYPADLIRVSIQKAEQLGLTGNIIEKYLFYLIANDKNIFSMLAEKNGSVGLSLHQAAAHDLNLLHNFLDRAIAKLSAIELLGQFSPTQPRLHPEIDKLTAYFGKAETIYTIQQITDALVKHYAQYGYGPIAKYLAFRWDGEKGLVGIQNPDPIQLDDIIGYSRQKEALVHNTEAFLAGQPCNNVLLTGARGTGKSSSVKALINRYSDSGLRLVELPKHEIKDLPIILATLSNYGKHFILFLDDLSFEEFETEYKLLKSLLEGGIETKPQNIVIYATSNRRHLIRETWNDRNESDHEVHRFDTVNEKISLSDRFGITLTYLSPTQEEYFNIVARLAQKHHIALPSEQLQEAAMQWELNHSGRSGRVAQQFIKHLLAKK